MTRRKRTPPPPAGAAATLPAAVTTMNAAAATNFQIPASLTSLSRLSANLARLTETASDDSLKTQKKIERGREIVQRAQAISNLAEQEELSTTQTGGGAAASSDLVRQPQQKKELKWKTTQMDFPDQQTWVKSVSSYATQGHARALAKRYSMNAVPEQAQTVVAGGPLRMPPQPSPQQLQQQQQQQQEVGNGEMVRSPMGLASGPGASAGQAPYPQIIDRMQPGNAPLRVRMDSRVVSAPALGPPGSVAAGPMAGALSAGAAGSGDQAQERQDGPPTKKRKVEFVSKHQAKFQFPEEQTWVNPVVRPKKKEFDRLVSMDVPGAGVASGNGRNESARGNDRDMQRDFNVEARRRAIMAGLNARASPARSNGRGGRGRRVSTPSDRRTQQQMQPSPVLGVGVGGMVQTPGTTPGPVSASGSAPGMDMAARSGSSPSASAMEYNKHQSEIAALIERKRAENAASGQVQRQLELRLAHQKKMAEQGNSGGGGGGVMGVSSPGLSGVGGQAGPWSTPTPIPTTMNAASGVVRGVAGGRGESNMAAGAAQRAIGMDDDDGDDDDEDAPGEDDVTTEPHVANGNPLTQQPHLITDPGDLESLFSSRDPSPPRIATGNGGGMPARRAGVGRGGHGLGIVAPSQIYQEEDDDPMSPSAQLLMALANAAPPPSWPGVSGRGGGGGGGGRRGRR